MYKIIIEIDEYAQAVKVPKSHLMLYLAEKNFQVDRKLLGRTLQILKKNNLKANVQDLFKLKMFMEKTEHLKWTEKLPSVEMFVKAVFK